MVRSDWLYSTHLGWKTPLWLAGLALAAVGTVLLVRAFLRARDPFFRLLTYSLIGAAAVVALFDTNSGFRIELVFLPPIAVGLALVTDKVRARLRRAGRERGLHRIPRRPSPA
jgi:hypothetical protein